MLTIIKKFNILAVFWRHDKCVRFTDTGPSECELREKLSYREKIKGAKTKASRQWDVAIFGEEGGHGRWIDLGGMALSTEPCAGIRKSFGLLVI